MPHTASIEVAVLLATYNGSRFVWRQIQSLSENATAFTLHWLDDKSTDNTVAAVRKCARAASIPLKEWRCDRHLGVPGSFFHLLERVEADIYLFCDQDDIWEAGKLDATVEYLLAHASEPALAFTGASLFDQDQPGVIRRPVDFSPNGHIARLLREGRLFAFMPGCPPAKTQGFTGALRDLFLSHKETAYAYAAFHDWWFYDIATACADIRMLSDAPGVLHRRHESNLCGKVFGSERRWPYRIWHQNQILRRIAARHARGLLIASKTLPPGERLDRMVALAQMVAGLEQRQSIITALRLVRLGFAPAGSRLAMSVNCVVSGAIAK